MRHFYLTLLLSFFTIFYGHTQTLNVFMTTTDCTTYGVCDGTITMWVEGASAADSFMFLLDVDPLPVEYDTLIVYDTIITLDSVCPGTYTFTLDTLWGSCPNYTGGCCNCIGSTACGGAPGGGASGTVGSPAPSLSAEIEEQYPYCFGEAGHLYLVIDGQAGPFYFSPAGMNNWSGPHNAGYVFVQDIYCYDELYTTFSYDVMDATGQIVQATPSPFNNNGLGYAMSYCVDPPFLAPISNIEVCSGEQVSFELNHSFVDPNLYFVWVGTTVIDNDIQSSNANVGLSNTIFSTPYQGDPTTNTYTFTASQVSSTEVTTVDIIPSFGYSSLNCGYYPETFTITVHPNPSLNAGQDILACEGDHITLSAITTETPVWDNGISDGVPFVQPIGTQTYSVEVSDANGCTNADQVDVIVNPSPTIDAGTNQTVCDGDQVTLSGSGGTTYAWNNGISDNTAFIPPIGTTTYEVTGTDANGCSNTDQVDVIVNASPAIDAGIDQTICEGTSISLSAVGEPNHSWDNGVLDGVSFVPPVGTNTYTVTATGANGCIRTDQIDIVVNALPAIEAGVNQTICAGDQVTLSGTGGTSYAWDNGISDNIAFTPATGITTYQVTGTDANGCSNTDQVDIIVNALPTIDAGLDQTICDGDQITLSGSGGTSYAWDNGISDNVAFTPTIGTTTYGVTGTDANGCSNTDQVDIIVNALPTIDAGLDQTICDGDQITLSGSGGTSYAWDNGVSDNVAFTPTIGTTTYGVIGTDANGCSNADQVDVIVNALPTIDAGINQTVCEGDQITLSGSGGVGYTWDNGVSDNVAFTPSIGTTTYAVTGTDANGCSNTDQVDVIVNALPTIDAGINQTVCEGDQITLSGSGGVSYIWDNGISDNVAFTPTTGTTTYSVTGTDANVCSNTDQVDVIVNALPTIDAGVDQTICEGDQITLSGSGGISYAWDNGISDNVAFTPTIGTTTYEVTGADANGCSNTDQVDVIVNALPTIEAGVDQSICDGDQVTLSGSGGTSYAWDNGISDNVAFTPTIGTTTYEVTGTDANGCSNTDQVDVDVNALPTIDAGADTLICFGDSLLLNALSNGSVAWTGGLANLDYFVPSNTQTELVSTATSTQGCQNTDTMMVTQSTSINTVLSIQNVADITATSGYTNYEWQYCESSVTIQNGTLNVYTATQDGNYKVIIRNSDNCFDTSACMLIDYLDLSENSTENQIQLAPNPTTGKVQLISNLELESVVVYDMFGRVVLQVEDDLSEIDLTPFENGTYVLEITTNTGKTVQRRVVKKE